MAEYIDKQTAIAEIEELNIVSFYELNKHSREAYQEIKLAISSLPPADVRPVVRGRWDIRAYGIDGEDVYCSVCECGCNMPYWLFCPMCGADMREGEDGDEGE